MTGTEDELSLALRRDELTRDRADGLATRNRGLKLLISIPAVAIPGFVLAVSTSGVTSIVLVVLAGVYTLVGAIGGLVMIAAGAAQYHSVSHRLDALDVAQLPAARVVVR